MNLMRGDLLETVESAPTLTGGEPRREIMRLVRMLRRNWLTIAATALVMIALGLVFVSVAEPSYRSTIRILLDQSGAGDVGERASLAQGTNVDEYIATQVAVFQSDVITKRVAQHLAVDGDRRLVLREPGAAEPSPEDTQSVLNALRRTLSVYRLDRSFVIEVAATSADPAVSQKIAAAVGDAYIADQSDSYTKSLSQAASWLEERIADLRRQSLEAAEAVEQFRARSGIRATEGQLISDQQLTGLSSQYVLAEANVSRLQSRHDVFQAAVNTGDISGVLALRTAGSDGEASPQLAVLGTDYLNAVERERTVVRNFGEQNAQLPAIRGEVERLSRQVLDEARRQLAVYSSDLEAARAQLQGLERSMQLAAGRSENSNVPLVQLRSTEQRANSLQALYQTYLQRYQETVQRQSLPLNSARLISGAEQASRPIFPNTKIALAFALVFGVGLGSAIALGREFFDASIRTRDDLRRLGLEPIGLAPRAATSPPSAEAAAALSHLRRGLSAAVKPHTLAGRPVFGCVVSCLPGEGRSFLTATLAEALAAAGHAVAVFDVSKRVSPTGGRGGAELVIWQTDEAPVAEGVDHLFIDSGSDAYLDLRRLSRDPGASSAGAVLSKYDVVLLDVPPLGSAAELRAIADAVDTIIVAVEWGRTERDLLQTLLPSGSVLRSKVAGAVLTKVDLRQMRKYDTGA